MILDGKQIGPDHPPYFIADMSLNHGGSLKTAKDLIALAAQAGCDAIKPQLYSPDELCRPGTIAKDGPWAGEDMWELYRKYQTPRSWIPELMETARQHKITLFFSVFSTTAVDLLNQFETPAYKISTSDYAWSKLRERCRATGKPTFVSVPKMEATPEIPLLNRPGYPCPLHDADLPELKKGTGVFGFSSHVMDPIVFPMAVALGASIIELNIIRSLSEGGPDASFSWEPWQIKQIREDTLKAWRAMRSQEDKAPSMMRNAKTGLREVA